MPVSRHACGRTYEWELSHHPDDTALAPWPRKLQALLDRPAKPSGDSFLSAWADEGPLTEGTRNDRLFKAAAAMRRHGLQVESILAALTEENRLRCEPPLANGEVLKIAQQAASYKPHKVQVATMPVSAEARSLSE